jgi:hypothetical protein
VIVRSPGKLPTGVVENPNTTVIEARVLDLTDEEMAEHVKDCNAVVSCLGHVMDLKGMFGNPRKLCTDATRRLCNAVETNGPTTPAKFILMNTVAVRNPALREQKGWKERGLLALLRLALPPAKDNESAARHLRDCVGNKNSHIEWCSVRPNSLFDAEVSPYNIHESPISSAFSSNPTTRSNVAHFMTELIDNSDLWAKWKFQMPVILGILLIKS